MSIYKKNGKYYCRGSLNGDRYNKRCDGASSRKEAQVIEDAIRYELRLKQAGIIKEKEKKYSFSFLMDKYVRTSEANNKSVKESKQYSKYLKIYFGENRDIKSIKPSDIEEYKLYMLSSGRSNATVNRYLAALKRAYNIMIKDELINYNPVCKVDTLIEDNRRNRYLSKDEWRLLYKELSPINKKIVTVALLTGLRKQNVLRLRWEQIDWNLRTIELSKSENKGKKTIKIPIVNTLYNLLQSLNPKECGYVFVNPRTNKPYTDIKKGFSEACKRAGIKDFKFHDLRRTVGTWLLESGVDIRTIQNILAHSEISTTERYLCLSSEQNTRAMNVLGSLVVDIVA